MLSDRSWSVEPDSYAWLEAIVHLQRARQLGWKKRVVTITGNRAGPVDASSHTWLQAWLHGLKHGSTIIQLDSINKVRYNI